MTGVSISISSSADVLARVGSARDVSFGAYILFGGPMRDALEAAARRGAHVAVTLQADPFCDRGGVLAAANAASAAELRGAGARVTLVPSARVAFHLKAAVCDGVAYLDDRNWPARGGDTVVADDDPRDVALVRDTLAGRAGADRALATRKDVALAREAALIDRACDAPVVLATESFGAGAVSAALRRHAARGAPTTLVVDRERLGPRSRALVDGLARDGVRVKNSAADEKLLLAGDAVWLGSANASSTYRERGEQTEWGIVSRDPALVARVRRTVARWA
jgi:phosphatidylserine/phosphatidylglycerophosphate/cardiolipin synthase-like enzyme